VAGGYGRAGEGEGTCGSEGYERAGIGQGARGYWAGSLRDRGREVARARVAKTRVLDRQRARIGSGAGSYRAESRARIGQGAGSYWVEPRARIGQGAGSYWVEPRVRLGRAAGGHGAGELIPLGSRRAQDPRHVAPSLGQERRGLRAHQHRVLVEPGQRGGGPRWSRSYSAAGRLSVTLWFIGGASPSPGLPWGARHADCVSPATDCVSRPTGRPRQVRDLPHFRPRRPPCFVLRQARSTDREKRSRPCNRS
jgi:hypothetical protein